MDAPLKILFCNYEYPPLGGGGGVVSAMLASELAKRHDVSVLTSKGLGLPAYSEVGGVKIYRVPVFFRTQAAKANIPSMLAYLPMGLRKGTRLIRVKHYDVINTHFVLPTGPVGQALARKGGVPNVLSVHGGDLYDPSKWTSPHRHAILRASIRGLLKGAQAVVGQSNNTKDNIKRYYLPGLEARLIPLGIKRPAKERATRDQFGFKGSDILLVTVGRLVSRKAVDQLIDLVAHAGEPRFQLIVVGSGPQGAALQAKAQGLDVARQVHFVGAVDESTKYKLLNISDLFVSSSQHEGFGLVFLEAMAAGLPVVCYDHGGQTDFLRYGETGYIITLNDTGSLSEHVLRLASDGEARRRMGAENQRRVEAFYIDRCAAQYEDVFREVITTRRGEGG
jgi:glycosyltransferase involved in cell wall biosynthesis